MRHKYISGLKQDWNPHKNKLESRLSSKAEKCVATHSYRLAAIRDKQKSFKLGGVSLVTPSFSEARRSWHLKIDLNSSQDLSLYLVERGRPLEGQNLKCDNFLSPEFSSVSFEISLQVLSQGTVTMSKLIPIFYSYAHNTNQVIGVSNLANLGDCGSDTELKIKIFMQELPVHSALMSCLASNFN